MEAVSQVYRGPAVNRTTAVITTLVGALAHARKDSHQLKDAKQAQRAEQRASKASMKARRKAAAISDNVARQRVALAKMHAPDLTDAKAREARLKGEVATLKARLATVVALIDAAARDKIREAAQQAITDITGGASASSEERPLVGIPGMEDAIAGTRRHVMMAHVPEWWDAAKAEREASWLAQREEAEALETARVEAAFARRKAIVDKTEAIEEAEAQTADARKAAADAHQAAVALRQAAARAVLKAKEKEIRDAASAMIAQLRDEAATAKVDIA